MKNKLVVFRGISGSGKTHICDKLMMRLHDNTKNPFRNVMKLSRDDLRASLFPEFIDGPSYTHEEEMLIDEWIKRSVRYFFHHHNNSDNRNDMLFVFVDGMCLNSNESVKSFEKLCKGIATKDQEKDETVKEIVEMTTSMNLPSMSKNDTQKDMTELHPACEKLTQLINDHVVQTSIVENNRLASFYCVEVQRDESNCKDAIEDQGEYHPAKHSRNYDKTKSEFMRIDKEYAKTINYKFVHNLEDKIDEIVNELVVWITKNN